MKIQNTMIGVKNGKTVLMLINGYLKVRLKKSFKNLRMLMLYSVKYKKND